MLNLLQHNFSISFQIFFFLWLCEIIFKSFISALLPPCFCPSLLLYSLGLSVIIFRISQTFSWLACMSLPYCVPAHHFEGWSQQQVYLWQWLCRWGNQPILKKKKKNLQKPVLKSFWLNAADYFQKVSQQLSKYFVASLDAVDNIDSIISCNGFYLPEQTEVLMQISVFVSVSLDLISVIPSVILTTDCQHLHKVALKLFVIL